MSQDWLTVQNSLELANLSDRAFIMNVSRRALIKMAVASALVGKGRGTTAVPDWVPTGYPAFYEDDLGLIVHKKPDPGQPDPNRWENNAGDTAQREGFVWFGIALCRSMGIQGIPMPKLPWIDSIKLLELVRGGVPIGEFVRHPRDPNNKGWNNPREFSKDQQVALVAALGALGPTDCLERFWRAFDGRGRVCQNETDVGGPDHQNLFVRALRAQHSNLEMQGIESFGEFLLAAMVWSLVARGTNDPDDVGDDLNFVVNLAAASQWNPTVTSGEAICEYVRTRPVNYGCFLTRYRQKYATENKLMFDKDTMVGRIRMLMRQDPTPDCHPIIGALRWYFRTETGAPWAPAAIWEPIVRRLLLEHSCSQARRI